MKKTYVCFSFDDGRIDNYTIAYPILKKYKLSATFNITTGYVEGKFEKNRLTNADPMTVNMVRELSQDPMIEIAGHGYWHKNSIDDILQGISALKQHLGSDRIEGFASPGTGLDLSYYHQHKQELLNSGVNYVRLSLRYLSLAKVKILIRKISRILPSPILYRWAYQDTLMDTVKNDILYSVPVLSGVSVSQLISLVNYAIKKQKICILMLHSIVDDGQVRDNWDFEKSKFESLCQYLQNKQSQGKVEVVTTKKAYHYLITKSNV